MRTATEKIARNALERALRRAARERRDQQRVRNRDYMRARRAAAARVGDLLAGGRPKRHELWRCPVCGMMRRIAAFNVGLPQGPDGDVQGHRLERRYINYLGGPREDAKRKQRKGGFEWSAGEPLSAQALAAMRDYLEAALARVKAALAISLPPENATR